MTYKTNKNTIHTNNNTNIKNIVKNSERNQTRIKDWTSYNTAMVNRGCIYDMFQNAVREDAIWQGRRLKKRQKNIGHPVEYSDAIVLFMATMRELFNLTLRQTEGFTKDLCKINHVVVNVPSYVTLSRRIGKLNIICKVDKRRITKNSIMLVDSTGFQILGEGNWFRHKHKAQKKRHYTKGHFIIDYKSEQVLDFEITPDYIGDAITTPIILDKLDDKNLLLDNLIGDGAYETRALYGFCEEHNITLLAPPREGAKLYDDYDSNGKLKKMPEWTRRNDYVRRCQVIGRKAWKVEADYHRRSLVENFMYRLKAAFTDRLKSKTFANQKAEIAIRVNLLNAWTNKYMPSYT